MLLQKSSKPAHFQKVNIQMKTFKILICAEYKKYVSCMFILVRVGTADINDITQHSYPATRTYFPSG